jgi:hypothetical protein
MPDLTEVEREARIAELQDAEGEVTGRREPAQSRPAFAVERKDFYDAIAKRSAERVKREAFATAVAVVIGRRVLRREESLGISWGPETALTAGFIMSAHAMLSSGWADSELTTTAKNMTGIKRGSDWKGAVTGAPNFYRIYPRYLDWVDDFIARLKLKRYRRSWESLKSNDAASYFLNLARDGWYPGGEDDEMRAIYNQLDVWRQYISLYARDLFAPKEA